MTFLNRIWNSLDVIAPISSFSPTKLFDSSMHLAGGIVNHIIGEQKTENLSKGISYLTKSAAFMQLMGRTARLSAGLFYGIQLTQECLKSNPFFSNAAECVVQGMEKLPTVTYHHINTVLDCPIHLMTGVNQSLLKPCCKPIEYFIGVEHSFNFTDLLSPNQLLVADQVVDVASKVAFGLTVLGSLVHVSELLYRKITNCTYEMHAPHDSDPSERSEEDFIPLKNNEL